VIDSHCHLADARFDADRAAVLTRAQQAGVAHIVAVTAKPSEWQMTLHEPWLHPAYGIHPWYCEPYSNAVWDALLLHNQQAVAVGECGLDFGQGRPAQSWQRHCFAQQLDMAQQLQLPVIIHSHKSLDAIIAMLAPYPSLRLVLHGFCGSKQQARRLLAWDCYFGIGSRITRPQSARMLELLHYLPTASMLLESDAPDQPPQQLRGTRNEPANLPLIAAAYAQLTGHSFEAIAQQTAANTQRCFGW
jgi:TatD DNase family protein